MNLNALNPAQKKAVLATEGRVLILAGAGSGKTSVLIHRMVHLIEDKKIPPSSILGLTFTNKAAEEMRDRMAQLLDASIAKKVLLCTFHSFCMRVLRKEIHRLGYTGQFTLYDEKDVRRLLNQLVREELKENGELPSLDPLIYQIAQAKNRGVTPKQLKMKQSKWSEDLAEDLFHKLIVCMRAYNAVDFDSLLSLTVELFEKHPGVLARYQKQFRYVMVDEYQDTNLIQYRLAKLISQEHQNLCVVGDDDQSIYGWRGAEIKNILEFESSTVIKLEQNYRSIPPILQAANHLIAHNKQRHQKTLYTVSSENEPIVLFHAPSDVEEAAAVVQRLIWLKNNKSLRWSDFAILYRSNNLSQNFEKALLEAVWQKEKSWVRGIPYRIFGSTELYERSEIKDISAYLRALVNPQDQESLLRILNVPRRGISEKTLDQLTRFNREQNIPLWKVICHPEQLDSELSSRAKQGLSQFVETMEKTKTQFQKRPLHATLTQFLEEINYKRAIEEEVKSEQMRNFKWENVLFYIEALKNYENEMVESGMEEEISLHHFLTHTALDQRKFDRSEKETQDRVQLMTFHSAKGLEFKACFLVGLEDHLIPHEKSLQEKGLEEERRLLYVAITRAKKYLTLSMAKQRKKIGSDYTSSPSRFLFEIPKELLKVVSWKQPF